MFKSKRSQKMVNDGMSNVAYLLERAEESDNTYFAVETLRDKLASLTGLDLSGMMIYSSSMSLEFFIDSVDEMKRIMALFSRLPCLRRLKKAVKFNMIIYYDVDLTLADMAHLKWSGFEVELTFTFKGGASCQLERVKVGEEMKPIYESRIVCDGDPVEV